ncbi:MAG: acyl--CoA ligase [Kofleriaceae bacterium]|nr:acyl--CoA ligase [Kofleriaceae bacterium]
MTPYLVHHLLEHEAARSPTRELLVTHEPESQRWSYRDADRAANRVAHALVAAGVTAGDRVAVLAHNGPGFVAGWFGALKAGAVVVPINSAIDPTSLAAQLTDCGARVLYLGARVERTVVAAGARLPAGLTVLVAPGAEAAARALAAAAPALTVRPGPSLVELGPDDEAAAARPPTVARIDRDPAAIIYTSGSTGRPRGAVLSHLALLSNCRSIVGYLGLGADDRVLVVLPFYYVYGLSLLTTATAVGAALVVENRFQYPAVALDTLAAEACTGLAGVPSTYAILVHRAGLAERALPSLRWVTQAGGGMSPALTRALMGALPGVRVHVMYGATEASARLAHLPPAELAEAIGSIGYAIPNVELTVRDDEGAPCAVDQVGELFARGSNLMDGYWGDPDETTRVLGPHGYATGDLARRDAAGRLWLVGRKKDLLKVGGHRVAAREIEDAIADHPAVAEVAVIGVPDELLGDRLRAFVVRRPGAELDGAGLGRFLRDRLAGYKIPEDIEWRDDLPKNPAGKVMKDALRPGGGA